MKTQVLGVKQLKALNLLASRMQDNAVRSLFIWAPKKRQRQADSSLRAQAAFLLLGLRGRGVEPSHCHPRHQQLRRPVPPGLGTSAEPRQGTTREPATPQGVQVTDRAGTPESKCARGELGPEKERTAAHRTETLLGTLSALGNSGRFSLITGTRSRGPGRAVVSADGGLVFFNKGRMETKVQYLGTNSLRGNAPWREGRQTRAERAERPSGLPTDRLGPGGSSTS